MSISSPSPCEIGSTSQTISSVPILSFSSISNLSDTLKEIPLVRPIDKRLLDLDSDFGSLSLIDECYYDHSMKLINGTDNSLMQSICSLLKQVDSSKFELIQQDEINITTYPPMLRSLLSFDNNVFNSKLGDVKFAQQTRVPVPSNPSPKKETIEHKLPKNDKFEVQPKIVKNQHQSPKVDKIEPKLSKVEKIETKPTKVEKESINPTSFYKKVNKDLPDDFTPELIEQLKAEGYDIMGSRRARTAKTTVKDESSDSEDEIKFKKKTIDKTVPSKVMPVYHQKTEPDQSNEHQSLKRLSQLLEDLLDSFEHELQQMKNNKDLEQDIPSEYLISRQLCADMAQEAFKVYTYSSINFVKKENLLKLQNLIFYNIKDGIRSLHIMNEVIFRLKKINFQKLVRKLNLLFKKKLIIGKILLKKII